MIAEESSSEPPGGEPSRPSERDLLAERRARRAAQTGDPVLIRRAEAAEATVQTLETHLSSLRQRLREAEDERRYSAQRLTASENELRRVKQQEYAEQQLRVEAERTLAAVTSGSAGEGALARSEVIQRLQARVTELELRAARLAEEIESERRARERTERALEAMRESHATMAATVGELRDVARKLRDAAVASSTEHRASAPRPALGAPGAPLSAPQPVAAPQPMSAMTASEPPGQGRREEMADALAAAVERLRARAEESSQPPREPAEALTPSTAPSAAVPTAGTAHAAKPKPHKHSMSLITRSRIALSRRRERRKQRRER